MKKILWFGRSPAGARLVLLAGALTLSANARADVVFAWNELVLHFAGLPTLALPPHLEARMCAMTHLAMADAIAAAPSGTSDSAKAIATRRAAAVWAARTVLSTLHPDGRPAIEALAERQLGGIAEGADKERGAVAGRAAAARILQDREGDGWSELVLLHPPAGPRPDGSEGAAVVLAHGDALPPSPWLRARPFLLKNAQQFLVTEVRTLQRDGGVRIADRLLTDKLFKEVDRSGPFDDAARWWAQRPLLGWNRLAREIVAHRSTEDLSQQARLLAVLNLVLADATLSALHAQHTVGSWRAITTETWEPTDREPPLESERTRMISNGFETALARLAIRRVLIPPTANYPSLTATLGGAAQGAIAACLGSDRVGFALPQSSVADAAGLASALPRRYESVSAAGRECAFAASLDGRHRREACIAGYELGAAIGRYASKRALAANR